MDEGDLSGVVLDGRYRVIEPVAEGAMGVVYRAERVKLGRILAIKVLHESLPNELRSRQRFELEAMAMAKLEHPNCAGVLDVGIHEDRPYVVMDFVSGDNLKEVLEHGPLAITRVVDIMRQVLSGLAHAHEHGIIHRDIKPANIVLSQKAGLGDHVKILDFGLARLSKDTSNLTTGIVVGTPSYMAPEQIRGVAIDTRADIYACGVLLFELLTGAKPFVSAKDDPIEVCSMHLKRPPPRLADVLPQDYGGLEDVVAKALAKAAGDRFASAVEFADALEHAMPRSPTVPVPRRDSGPVATPAPEPATPPAPDVASPRAGAAGDEPRPAGSAWVDHPAPVAPPPSVSAVAAAAPSQVGGSIPPRPSVPPIASAASMPAASGRGEERARAEAEASPNAPIVFPPVGRAATPVAASSLYDRQTPEAVASNNPASRFDLSAIIPQPSGISTAPDLPSSRPPNAPAEPPPTVIFAGAPPSGPSPLGTPFPAAPSPAAGGRPPVNLMSPPASTTEAPMAVPSNAEGRRTRSAAESIAARWSRLRANIPFSDKQLAIAGGTGVFVLVIVVALIAGRGGPTRDDAATATADARVEGAQGPGPTGDDPVGTAVSRASEELARGDRDSALDIVIASRRLYPEDARLAYLGGKIYFAKLWWTDGLRQFRDAIRLDPGYREDDELIKTVLRGFITTPSYNDELAEFLRADIGEAAKPLLEETANKHPNAAVRSRAAAELRQYR